MNIRKQRARKVIRSGRAIGFMLVIAGFFSGAANAAPCRHDSVAIPATVTLPAGFIAVPLAVPVALPSYVQYQAPWVSYVAPVAANHEPAPVAAAAAPSPATRGATGATTLIAAQCGTCHGGAKPKADLDLTGALADSIRLKAIARLLSDDPEKRMPPQKELSPESLGHLIQELSARDESVAP